MKYPTEYHKFTEQKGNEWLLLEDDLAVKLAQRWEKAEVIYHYGGVKQNGGDHQVASQSNAEADYIVNGACQCPDYQNYQHNGESKTWKGSPHGWCKHRLAVWLYQEREALKERVAQMKGETNMNNGYEEIAFKCQHCGKVNTFQRVKLTKEPANVPGPGPVCPTHGLSAVSKFDTDGLYCPTRENGQWCKWRDRPKRHTA